MSEITGIEITGTETSQLETTQMETRQIETNQLENINNEIDNNNKNKLIKECYLIYSVIKKYIALHKPIFIESFNEERPLDSIYNTYILEIPYNVIFRIIKVLKLLHYQNKTYLSNDGKNITGLSYKSYAYYKEILYKNEYIKFVFCLENDKYCKGILLSPEF
jgi:hypothetical protein